MKEHYNEADLLETYYMQPSEASEIIAHVDGCGECQDRYRRLAQKLRETSTCETDKPETFWTRQRMIISRAVERARHQSEPSTVRGGRIAAAAMLAFVLGGAVVYKTVRPAKAPVVVVTQQAADSALSEEPDLQVPRDPWQDDELKDFGTVVAWESWNE
jgi:predicted anti-sigma-YlaC factor YlaD